MNQTRCLLALTMGILLSGAVRIGTAATFTCGASDVACLINAMRAANSTLEPDTIRLAAGVYTLTAVDNITDGPNGLPSVTEHVTLVGAGADQTVIARSPNAPPFRLLHVAPFGGSLGVVGLTLTGGNTCCSQSGGGIWNGRSLVLADARLEYNLAEQGGGLANLGGSVIIERSEIVDNHTVHEGGGIYTRGGTVTIRQSTLAENGADGPTAIYNRDGTVIITDSAVVDNTGRFHGTAISSNGVLRMTNTTLARNAVLESFGGDAFGGEAALGVWGGDVILTNSTIVDNTGTRGPGLRGIARTAGAVVLSSTIVARNAGDCVGVITSAGHNLIGDPTGCTLIWQPTDLTGDPGLDAYADDSSPGDGHYPLLAMSRAVDAGNPATCPPTDQLGQPRVGPCDIGAVEFQPPRVAQCGGSVSCQCGDTVVADYTFTTHLFCQMHGDEAALTIGSGVTVSGQGFGVLGSGEGVGVRFNGSWSHVAGLHVAGFADGAVMGPGAQGNLYRDAWVWSHRRHGVWLDHAGPGNWIWGVYSLLNGLSGIKLDGTQGTNIAYTIAWSNPASLWLDHADRNTVWASGLYGDRGHAVVLVDSHRSALLANAIYCAGGGAFILHNSADTMMQWNSVGCPVWSNEALASR